MSVEFHIFISVPLTLVYLKWSLTKTTSFLFVFFFQYATPLLDNVIKVLFDLQKQNLLVLFIKVQILDHREVALCIMSKRHMLQ